VTQQPDRDPVKEGEILPPENKNTSYDRVYQSWGGGTVKIVKLGPLGATVMMLAFGLMLVLGLIFLSGILVFLVAGLVILGAGAYLANGLRGLGRLWR